MLGFLKLFFRQNELYLRMIRKDKKKFEVMTCVLLNGCVFVTIANS